MMCRVVVLGLTGGAKLMLPFLGCACACVVYLCLCVVVLWFGLVWIGCVVCVFREQALTLRMLVVPRAQRVKPGNTRPARVPRAA